MIIAKEYPTKCLYSQKMLNRISKFILYLFQKVKDVGVKDTQSFQEQEKIKLLNIICLIVFFSGVLLMLSAISNQVYFRVVANAVAISISLIILFFQYRGLPRLARSLFFSMMTLYLSFFSLYYNQFHLTHYLLTLIIFTFIFFDNRITVYIFLFITGGTYIFLNYYFFSNKEILLKAHDNFLLSVVVLAVFYIILILFRLKEKTSSYLHTIEEQNIILQNQKEEINITADTLREINDTKDKLFSIIGHDLRSPINQLKSIMQLLEDRHITQEEFFSLSHKLKTGVDDVHYLLDNLLSWSYNQLTGIKTIPEFFLIEDLILQKIHLYSEVAKTKKISIEFKSESQVEVFADKTQIGLVLQNLINNAVKFTPENGSVLIHSAYSDRMAQVSVIDSGVGMKQETINQFFQDNKLPIQSGTAGETGTGLGLRICKEMVEANSGSIWVKSELGKGTEFIFSIPTK